MKKIKANTWIALGATLAFLIIAWVFLSHALAGAGLTCNPICI